MSFGKQFPRRVLFLLISCSAIQAQNAATPGELPKLSTPSPLSPINSRAGASPVLPKTDIANVEDSHTRNMRKVWVASVFTMIAGTTADAASSWHKREGNSLLASSNGVFGPKGVALKAAIAAGVLTPQIILRKHRDWRLSFAVGNFAEAGIFAGVTIHNVRIK